MIPALLQTAVRNVESRIGGMIRDELHHRRAQPCVTAEYMRLRLQTCRPVMRPWFRWRHRVWTAKCVAAGFRREVCGG